MKDSILVPLLAIFILTFSTTAAAQIFDAPVYIDSSNTLTVRFRDAVEKVNDKVPVSDPEGRLLVPCPVLYFQQDEETHSLYCDAFVIGENLVRLSNFRTSPRAEDKNSQTVNLIRGSTGNCRSFEAGKPDCIVEPIADGRSRQYFVHWPGKVKVRGQGRPQPVFAEVKLGSSLEKTPLISVSNLIDTNSENERNVLHVTPEGITPDNILNIFSRDPGSIKVLFDFSEPDFRDFETSVTAITCLDGTVNLPCRDDRGRTANIMKFTLGTPLPIHATKYSAIVKIPWQPFRDEGLTFPADEWKIPEFESTAKDFLTAGSEIKLMPLKPERGKSEYAFETAFTSTVNSANGKRNNVGIFGLTIKPSIGLRSYGVSRNTTGNNGWLALRPLLIADVDTQRVSKSKSPNRIQAGVDLEWGTNLGLDLDENTGRLVSSDRLLRQIIWTNGMRYDSDRDFKLQTTYWRTEVGLGFRKFEQTYDQTFFRFQKSREACEIRVQGECDPARPKECTERKEHECGTSLEPLVSSYFFRPSFGYELGGTIRRDACVINAPTKNISRAFFHLQMGIELKRVAKFSIDDTYYYLQNAPRLKNRNYLETIFELNTGRLSGIDLSGISNSIFLKFQRGDQPPTFGPVNALSIGFKIYK